MHRRSSIDNYHRAVAVRGPFSPFVTASVEELCSSSIVRDLLLRLCDPGAVDTTLRLKLSACGVEEVVEDPDSRLPCSVRLSGQRRGMVCRLQSEDSEPGAGFWLEFELPRGG